MEVKTDRSHSKSSDDVQEEHTATRRLLQEVPSDPEFPLQPITSRVNRVVHTNVKITGRVQPCEDVKGEPKDTPEESSVDECHQTASDNLTGLGQLSECNGHGRDVMLAQIDRNVEGLPSAEDKLVHDKKKRDQYPRPSVQNTADQCEHKNTVNTENDTSENDQAPVQDVDENCQPLVQVTHASNKSTLPNYCIPQHQIVPGLRLRENKSFFRVMMYVLFSVYQPNGQYFVSRMMYALFSVYRPNLVRRMMYVLCSVYRPNGPYLVGRMMYTLFSVYRQNGQYFVGRMMYMLCSVYRPNGLYLVGRMMYTLCSVYRRNGPYLVRRMMYALFSVYRPNRLYLVGLMMYALYSVYRPKGQYFVGWMMYTLCSVPNGQYFVGRMMYTLCSVYRRTGPYLVGWMLYALYSVYRPNGPCFVGPMMYTLCSVYRPNGPNLMGQMMYALFSVYRPNGPYLVGWMMYALYFVYRPYRQNLVGWMMYMLFWVYRPNGQYLVSRMMYPLFSVYQLNGPYFWGRMMYTLKYFFGHRMFVHFSVYLKNKQYFLTRMMIMQHIILCRDQAYVLLTLKACMKLVNYFLMEDFNVSSKGCFPKSEQQKYKKEIIETAQLYGQEVKVYAVVVNNYGDGEFIQNQQQYQPDPVEVLDGPIQHPAQNDIGVLAITNQESPLQMYNQDQPQHHPDPVEVLEGPIQHPQQNDAAMLAITDQEPIPNINDRQQLPNDHAAVVINGDLIPQLTLVIAVTVVAMAILTENFIW